MQPHDIGDQNVERLLGAAYQPEQPDPAFAQRLHGHMQAAARTLRAPAQPTPEQIRKLRRRLGWALAAAAAVASVALTMYAANRPERGSQTSHLDDQGATATLPRAPHGAKWAGKSTEGLTARPRVVLPETKIAVGTDLVTKAGERRRVALADGSVLYLNAGTRVRYLAERQIRLIQGELYVEVAPREDVEGGTFLVQTGDREVRALGTRFSVWADGAHSGIVVTQGKVRVSGLEGLVYAGQQLAPGATLPAPAPRATHLLDWTRELMIAAESPLVPCSQHAGGALVAVDSSGQDVQLNLRRFLVDVHIEDGFARTTIDQTYFNNQYGRLEGTFYFPLPADAVLSRLAMYVKDGDHCKLMEGGMAERDHARATYETILHTRRDPALLEWVDGTTFKMRVFPLEPREEKRIILSYTQKLSSLYGITRYRFPAGHSMQQVGDWSFRATVKNGARLRGASPSHPDMKIRPEDNDLVCTAFASFTALKKDVALELTDSTLAPAGAKSKPAAKFATFTHEGAQYLMLRYRPELDSLPKRERRDWVFLYECAANRDPLLARAQIDVIRQLLENAEHNDTFTLVAAGTRVQVFDANARLATPANVKEAVRFLEGTQLIGALDLGQALAAVEPTLLTAQNPHLVHVGSGIATIGERRADALVQKIPARAKYVGVGVGKQWGRTFMKQAADHTGGLFTQINPDEPVNWRSLELLATLNTPRLLEVRVVDSDEKVAFLSDVTTIAQGEEICAVGRLDAGAALPKTLTVAGALSGKRFVKEFTVENVAGGAGYLPRQWAKLELDRLLAQDAEKNKAQIIALSMKSYVMTPYTSLLVLETEADYERFKVDRGRKDHWAMYACPEKIAVVHEPIAYQPAVPAVAAPKVDKADPEMVLSSIVVRVPPQAIKLPNDLPLHHPPATTAHQLFVGAYGIPLGMCEEEFGIELGLQSPVLFNRFDFVKAAAAKARQTQAKLPTYEFPDFRNRPYTQVLEWLTEITELPVISQYRPSGSFTAPSSAVGTGVGGGGKGKPGVAPGKTKFTVPEIIDILNESLIQQKFTIIRRSQSILIWPIDEALDPQLVRPVTVDELMGSVWGRPTTVGQLLDPQWIKLGPVQRLPEVGNTEMVKVIYPLTNMTPEAFAPAVKKMMGPFSQVIPLEDANRLILIDTAENIRNVINTIKEIESIGGASATTWSRKLDFTSASEVAERLKDMLGDPGKIEAVVSGMKGGSFGGSGFGGGGFGGSLLGGGFPGGLGGGFGGGGGGFGGGMQNIKARMKMHTISFDARTNTVFVSGPPAKINLAKAVANELDKPNPNGQPKMIGPAPLLRTYMSPAGNAEAIAMHLKELYKGSPTVRIQAVGSSQFMVLASPDDQMAIAMLMADTAPDPGRVAVIGLDELDSDKVAEMLRSMYGDLAKMGAPYIESDPIRNAIIVKGTPEQILNIKRDLRDIGATEYAGRGKMEIITIDRGSSTTLAKAVSKMLEQLYKGPVTVIEPTQDFKKKQGASTTVAVQPAQKKDPKAKGDAPITITAFGNKIIVSGDNADAVHAARKLTKLYSSTVGGFSGGGSSGGTGSIFGGGGSGASGTKTGAASTTSPNNFLKNYYASPMAAGLGSNLTLKSSNGMTFDKATRQSTLVTGRGAFGVPMYATTTITSPDANWFAASSQFQALFYERPNFSADNRLFADLPLYAPGMNTTAADIQAVLEAEANPVPEFRPGAIDAEARKLIDQARTAGWQKLTVAAEGRRSGFALFFNGKGHFAWERTLPNGLREQVICDGATVWHLYPELGLASKRPYSRFHHAELNDVVPWLLPAAEDLARGFDVRAVNHNVVALVARDVEKDKLHIAVHLVFDGSRLVERQLVAMPANVIVYRQRYAADGTITVDAGAVEIDEPLATVKLAVAAADPPNLTPHVKDLVIVPMPLRVVQSTKDDIVDLDADKAIALIANASAVQNAWTALEVFGKRFHVQGDRRLGFYVLLAGSGARLVPEFKHSWNPLFTSHVDVVADHPKSPVARYLLHHWENMGKGNEETPIDDLGGPQDSFIRRLAAFREHYVKWNTGKVAKSDVTEQEQQRVKSMALVGQWPLAVFDWALLDAMIRNGAATDEKVQAAYTASGDGFGLGYAVRYEIAAALHAAGKQKEASMLFRKLHADTLEAGHLPIIDRAFRDALNGGEAEEPNFAAVMRQTANALAKRGHRLQILAVVCQAQQLGDNQVANDLLAQCLAVAEKDERSVVRLLAVQYYVQTNQIVKADAMLKLVLAEEPYSRSPALWRLANQLASQRGLLAYAVSCLEQAMDLEYRELPATVDLKMIREEYGSLLSQYQQMANAMALLDKAAPKEFVAKVIRAADRWRALDPDPTAVCQQAAKILQSVGAAELAWDYLTTPLALKPNEAAPWRSLAQTLQADGGLDLADKAFALAFEAESTNAEILRERAMNLEQAGRGEDARAVYEVLATTQWQPRFQWIATEAQERLQKK